MKIPLPTGNVAKREAEGTAIKPSKENDARSGDTDSLNKSTSASECPVTPATLLSMPMAPQRAVFRSANANVGMFRMPSGNNIVHEQTTREDEQKQTKSSNQTQEPVNTTTNRQDSSDALGVEWANERLEELSLEISKLIKDDTQPAEHKTADTEHIDHRSDRTLDIQTTKSAHKRVPSIPEPRNSRRSSSRNLVDGLSISQQPLNLYKVPAGIMQVFVMGVHPSNPISRSYVVVRLGDQVFQTSVSKTPTGSWNEGFELIVSYHMQLFGTVHLDVYSSNMLLPDTHIGRAEIKLSLLEGFPEIFTSYYEVWDKKLAASTVPEQKQREVISKNLGALQVRINYRFQKLEDPEPKIARSRGVHIAGTLPNQLVNRIAESQMGGGDSAASFDQQPIEDLVTRFANEFNKYMDMARVHGRQAFIRKGTTATATAGDPRSGAAGVKQDDAGFARVDDDAVKPEEMVGGSKPQDAATSKGGGPGGWFSELFSGLSSTAATAPPTADGTSTSTDVKAPNNDNNSNDGKQKDAAQTANDRTLVQSLTSMFISPSVFMVVKSLDRLIDTFNQGIELSNTELLGGLLTLYKFYNEADIPGVTRPHKGQIVESVEQLQVPGHYARFALATYGWRALYFFNRGITLMDGAKIDSDVTSVLQYLNMAPEDLLGYEFRSSQLFCPSYFVAHDRQYDAVVLSVRGTMSAEDTVVDLSCEYTKWNGGLVHSGMQASAHWLFVKVVPRILAYARSQGIRRIRIVGHSLGASTAAILMIMVRSVRDRLRGLGVDMDEYDIRAYCYGPAPCVSDNIADRFRDCIDTYVNRDDIVPRLCYGSVSDFKRMSVSASDEADNLAQRLYAPFEDSVLQQRRWKDKFSRLMQIRKDIVAAQENLHLALPGTIHHIVSYRGGAGGKDKRAPQDPELDVTFGKHELFGDVRATDTTDDNGAASDGPGDSEGATTPTQPPPPPTPETQVQQECVDPEELADAINTPIGREPPAAVATDVPKQPDTRDGKTAGAAASGTVGGSDKFYPAWVQRVPNNSFREIILRSTIVTDHMPSAYELAFEHAIETQLHERRLMSRRRRTNNPPDESLPKSQDVPSGDKDSGGGGGYHDDWRDYHPNDTTVYRYGVASQHHHRPLVWWRRWASIEGLVFGIRRNMGFIRLSAALLLSLIWSPAIVQIAIVGYTGQCHIAVSSKNGSAASSRNGDSGGGRGGGGGDNAGGTAADVVALDACDLVRKALVTSIFAWVSSSLMAVLLVLVNTTGSMGLQAKDLMPYHIVPTDPTPLAGGGVIVPNGLETANVANGVNSGGASGLFGGAGIYQRTSGLFSSKLNSNSGTGLQMTGHMPFNQGLFHPHYLIHHPHGSTAASTTGPKDPNIAQYRASWSHTDGESIVSELSRLEGQGITKAHIGQHQQPNTLHQSYHMKSQSQLHPLHGINQFHPPSRISEEEQHQMDGRSVVDQHSNLSRNLAFAYGSTQRRARAAFYKTRYSTSILGMADPLAHMGGGSEAKMLRDGAGGAQRQHYQMQQYLNHGRPPLPGIVASRSGGVVARSLARPSYESCDGVLATASLGGADSFGIDTGSGGGGNDGDGDSKIKRNTIG
ncbi:hypothetical protein GGH99_001782 [Coemansia sp. RSA 1285]|nr:hypothetical protein GGH99_001782 [Coemansia sp. RSA 1285]